MTASQQVKLPTQALPYPARKVIPAWGTQGKSMSTCTWWARFRASRSGETTSGSMLMSTPLNGNQLPASSSSMRTCADTVSFTTSIRLYCSVCWLEREIQPAVLN